jgi:hypothetical protein
MVGGQALRYRKRGMGRDLSQSIARSLAVALVIALAACNGGSDRSGERPKPTSAPTSGPAPTIDLSKPIPGGSLHGTPRPPLENTGTDYVAIFKSLDVNFRWLTENPDPAVISELFVPGTRTHDFQLDFVQTLAQNGWRSADEGYRVLAVDVVDARSDVVSLRLTDQFDAEKVVDSSGRQIGDGKQHTSPTVWTILLSPDDLGRWRIADASPVSGAQVQL